MSACAARSARLAEPPEEGKQPASGPLIAVVGPCGSGKSTLSRALRSHGFRVRDVAQEHSFAPAMWQRIARPDLLIYLDVSRETAERRRAQQFPASWWEETQQRLAHARAHADLLIDTDTLEAEEVCRRALSFLEAWGADHQRR